MLSKNHPIILFLDRDGFSVFQDTQPSIKKFNFTSDSVANLDITNKEQLANLITAFIQTNKIIPSSFVIVLSDSVIYFKDLNPPKKPNVIPPAPNPASELSQNNEPKKEIQNFLDDVPFEEVLAKVIKTDQLNFIVAANKDLVMAIADSFVNKGFIMEGILPSFLYGPVVNFTKGLTQDNIQAILGGSEVLRTGNLLTDQQLSSSQSFELEQKNKEKPTKNIRQYILIGVFVVLLVILGITILTGKS